MEVIKVKLRIGNCYYYEKTHPASGEKYISVSDYNRIYKEDGRKNNALKPISIYDEKDKVYLYFISVKEAAKQTNMGRTTIAEALSKKREVLVKKRYRFIRNKPVKTIDWQYSNKNYG